MSERKIRALIADDELLARKFVRRLLKQDRDIEIVGECSNGKEAVALIQEQKPDLVFLDIQMPEMDGFAVLDALGVDQLPEIVFTTAYESYALRAFELHAVDYLLKPFDQVRFKAALKHARDRCSARHPDETRLQIGTLLESIKTEREHLDRLVVKADGRITFLNTRDIEWIEADDKYVHLHTTKGKRMIRQTLSAMEAELDPKRFVRVHRSAIVNIERVQELQPLFNGEHSLLLDTGTKLTLSRTYKEKLFGLLGKPL
jgi:two-component system, LytTR family, response regulator